MLDMVPEVCNSSTGEAETGGLFKVLAQPGLHEFQGSVYNQWCWQKVTSDIHENDMRPSVTPHAKVNAKQIKIYQLILLEKKYRKAFRSLSVLGITLKTQVTEVKWTNRISIKQKPLHSKGKNRQDRGIV